MKAQEAKTRSNEKKKTGAAGCRPPTSLLEILAAFFGHNAAVCKPDLVWELRRAEATHSPESSRRLGGYEQDASGGRPR